ncbi:MAG: nucleoside deaminase [Candidatus Bathyarchaeota archaeon]|nr:nucleoside deaminase [Candidatus Bathyarchaeota archaeon]
MIKLSIQDFTLTLPNWAIDELKRMPEYFPSIKDRMEAVIRFSQLNIDNGTGGPFAAGVFERDTGKLVVIGVNRVLPTCCSSAHAEIMALSLAQKKLGTYDLGGPELPAYQLVVNWLPCVMCYGAVIWSGIRSLAVAGSGPELEDITGFDEGPHHPEWAAELRKRGIEVIDDVLREKACRVFHNFAEQNSLVYNSRQGKPE